MIEIPIIIDFILVFSALPLCSFIVWDAFTGRYQENKILHNFCLIFAIFMVSYLVLKLAGFFKFV